MALRCVAWSPPGHEHLRRGQREALRAFWGAPQQFPLGLGAESTYILMSLVAWLGKQKFLVCLTSISSMLSSLLAEGSKVRKQSPREGGSDVPGEPARRIRALGWHCQIGTSFFLNKVCRELWL